MQTRGEEEKENKRKVALQISSTLLSIEKREIFQSVREEERERDVWKSVAKKGQRQGVV